MPHLTRRHFNCALAASLTALVHTNPTSAAPPPDPARADLADLLREISRTEQSITNMTIEGAAVEQHLIADQWVAQPISSTLLARYDAKPGGKSRFDVTSEVAKWIDGDGPYSDASYSVAYNGKSSTVVHISGGALGRTGPDPTALILPGRAPNLNNAMCYYASGARFHMNLWDFLQSTSLAGYFRPVVNDPNPAGVRVTIGRENRDGIQATRIDLIMRAYRFAWWIDPKRGHNLLGYRVGQIDKKTGAFLDGAAEERVVELRKVLDKGEEKLWYPTEAYYYFPTDPGETKRRLHYKATRAVLNDPAFDDAIFDLAIPAGYFVDDRINHRRYQIPHPKGPIPIPHLQFNR